MYLVVYVLCCELKRHLLKQLDLRSINDLVWFFENTINRSFSYPSSKHDWRDWCQSLLMIGMSLQDACMFAQSPPERGSTGAVKTRDTCGWCMKVMQTFQGSLMSLLSSVEFMMFGGEDEKKKRERGMVLGLFDFFLHLLLWNFDKMGWRAYFWIKKK